MIVVVYASFIIDNSNIARTWRPRIIHFHQDSVGVADTSAHSIINATTNYQFTIWCQLRRIAAGAKVMTM